MYDGIVPWACKNKHSFKEANFNRIYHKLLDTIS